MDKRLVAKVNAVEISDRNRPMLESRGQLLNGMQRNHVERTYFDFFFAVRFFGARFLTEALALLGALFLASLRR